MTEYTRIKSVDVSVGDIFTVTKNHNGNFKVGDSLEVTAKNCDKDLVTMLYCRKHNVDDGIYRILEPNIFMDLVDYEKHLRKIKIKSIQNEWGCSEIVSQR